MKLTKVQIAARLLLIEALITQARAALLLETYDEMHESLVAAARVLDHLGYEQITSEYFLAAEPPKAEGEG